MKNEDYSITPDQVLALLQGIKLPASIVIRQGEQVLDVPLFISTNISRMHCGSAILEQSAKRRMSAMALLIHELNQSL